MINILDKALEVLKKINSFGYQSYIVGGYPRDLYLKKASSDIDICTDARPIDIMNIFSDISRTNEEYGSVVIIYKKIKFTITTFRKEGKYKNNRGPSSIKYIDDLTEDLKRRDFTINTICLDENGKMIDTMNAKKDLDDKIIRMVGDPKKRLKEDALRILRAVRFATTLNFEIEPVLKVYIKKYAHFVRKLSKDRQKDELDLIFASSNKEYGIKLLCDLKLADYLEIPKLKKIKITSSMLVTWAQLDVLEKFNFSSSEKRIIKGILDLKDKDLLDSKVLYGNELYICSLATELTEINKVDLNKVYSNMPIHSKLDIALKPDEICKILDKKPGGFLKEIISDIEDKILSGYLKNTKEDITNYIKINYFKQ